jgi:hypothetical protein
VAADCPQIVEDADAESHYRRYREVDAELVAEVG